MSKDKLKVFCGTQGYIKVQDISGSFWTVVLFQKFMYKNVIHFVAHSLFLSPAATDRH